MIDDDETPIHVKSCLWLQTFHFSLPFNLMETQPGTVFEVRPVKIGFLKCKFTFFVVKVTQSDLIVTCTRTLSSPEEEDDDGYLLQFHFSMVGFDDATKTVDMHHDDDFAYVTYTLASLYRPFTELKYTSYIFDLKVVVKMVEFKCLENPARRRMEDIIDYGREKFSPQMVSNLGYLLDRPGFIDVFTGKN